MRTFTWQRTGIIIPNSSDFKDFLEQCERLLDGREIELVKVIRIPDNGSIEVIKRVSGIVVCVQTRCVTKAVSDDLRFG